MHCNRGKHTFFAPTSHHGGNGTNRGNFRLAELFRLVAKTAESPILQDRTERRIGLAALSSVASSFALRR